jgi:ParB-like chromosome segregation protein Spo0J
MTQFEKDKAALIAGLGTGHQAKQIKADAAKIDPRALSDVISCPLGKLTPHPDNDFDELPPDEMQRLTDDIKARGVLVPLIVAPDRNNKQMSGNQHGGRGGVILCGHNRYRAAQAAGLPAVPVMYLRHTLTPDDERRMMIADNLLRRQLDPAQKARYLALLYPEFFDSKKQGRPAKIRPTGALTAGAVAKQAGVSLQTVTRAKAVHNHAKAIAERRGQSTPTPADYAQAAPIVRPSESKTLPGIGTAARANKTARGKVPFAVPATPDNELTRILTEALARIGREDAALIAADLITTLRRADFTRGQV